MMSLKQAEEQFADIMQALNETNQKKFLTFIKQEWKPDSLSLIADIGDYPCNAAENDIIQDPVFLLNSIAADIRKELPLSAILPSENIAAPKIGENSDCKPDVTLHVDEFLYDEDDVNDMIEAGKIKKFYCTDCGSKNVEELIFVSHSMSRDALYHIFNNLLPTLEGKTVLDVGSRLGAVLYGAYAYTDAAKIIGVEMNEEFCQLQSKMINKYQMNDRVEVVHKRIEDAANIVSSSDVIIINNSFEFYLSVPEQVDVWKFLKDSIKSGTILVTQPNIYTLLGNLPTGIDVDEWLKSFTENCSSCSNFSILNSVIDIEDDKHLNIACYEVL